MRPIQPSGVDSKIVRSTGHGDFRRPSSSAAAERFKTRYPPPVSQGSAGQAKTTNGGINPTTISAAQFRALAHAADRGHVPHDISIAESAPSSSPSACVSEPKYVLNHGRPEAQSQVRSAVTARMAAITAPM